LKRLILLIAATWLFGADMEIPGTYTYLEAIKVCPKKLGKKFRIMEIWELFELRGQVDRFGKNKRYWSGNTVGEARIVKDVRHEGEIYVLDQSLPAFAFFLQDGDITPTPKSVKAHVICTDQPKIHQLDKDFTRQKDGSVIDKKSKILWEPLDVKRSKMRYEDASRYCEELRLFGREWRLPSLDELYGIVNYNYVKPAVNKKIFGPMRFKYYLSDEEFGEDGVYVVGFSIGTVATVPKEAKVLFRCVSDLE